MSALFGVRLKCCGPNRLAIMTKAREWLRLPPAEVKSRMDAGAVIVVEDVSMNTALQIASEWTQLGAEVEVFISTSCPSCGGGEHAEPHYDPPRMRKNSSDENAEHGGDGRSSW